MLDRSSFFRKSGAKLPKVLLAQAFLKPLCIPGLGPKPYTLNPVYQDPVHHGCPAACGGDFLGPPEALG